MNKAKNIVIAILLLYTAAISNQEQTISIEPDIAEMITEPTSVEEVEKTTSEEKAASSSREEASTTPPSATAEWNNHLESLKEKDLHWNKNSNIPTESWKEEAIVLAKKIIDQDKTLSDTIKSAFFNVITDKIKLEEGEFTASTYALIKEFDDAIDAYRKTLTESKPPQETQKEEPTIEPVIEVVPTPPLDETLTPQEQEETSTQPVITQPIEPAHYLQEWNDQLIKITTTGKSDNDNRNLLLKTYELAKELLLQGYTQESLFAGFESAILQHNANQSLYPININQAIEAFSAETEITPPYNQQMQAQQQYDAAIKKQTEQQEIAKKQKDAERKTTATVQEAIKKANISESDMQRLSKKLEERLALERAMREAQQKATEATIASLKQQLTSAHKVKIKEVPQEQGIVSRAIGAVKGAASAATAWWYGEESQEQKDIKTLDEDRFKKLQEILTTMTLTAQEKEAIEKNWTTFITQLRSFKDVDINNVKEISTWLHTVQQSLEFLIFTHHIISIKEAVEIMKNAIEQYPDSSKFINSIESRLTKKQNEIITAKQKNEDIQAKKIQEREQRKQLIERKKQKVKEEEECIKAAKNSIEAYECEKTGWQKFLTQIAQHKNATEQQNSNYTNEAIRKAQSLLNPAQAIVLKNKQALAQQLKEQFTNALLKQQENNERIINIHKNMEQFNTAINNMS